MARYKPNKDRVLPSSANKKHRMHTLPFVPQADIPDLSADMDKLPTWQYSEASRLAGAVQADYRQMNHHVYEKHLDKSDKEMLNRCLIKQDAARKYLHGREDAAPYGAVSSFKDKERADNMFQQTLDEHKLSIAAWAAKAPNGRRFKMMSSPSKEPIGHGFLLTCDKDSGTLSYMESHQAVLIVEKCDVFENKNGIKLVTFYPDIQEEQAKPVEKDLRALLHSTEHYHIKSNARKAFLDSTLSVKTQQEGQNTRKELSLSEKSYLENINKNASPEYDTQFT